MASHPIVRLGIDARMYGLEHAGIGRYVMNLVDRVVTSSLPVHWVIFIHHKYAGKLPQKPNLTVVPVSIRHYSLAEQTIFLTKLLHANLNLLHVPHFNVPLLYRRPFMVTIHDILWHKVKGGSVTTLSPFLYYLKYTGYRQTVRHATAAATTIIVPSDYVKKDLIHTLKLSPEKIHVTYEAGSSIQPALSDYDNHNPYFIYIGSAYPHKNIPVIFDALKHLKDLGHAGVKLMIVSSRSVFLDRLKQEVGKRCLDDQVNFAGHLSDEVVLGLLHRATALIHPSKSEGFGLTGIEAMQAGTPVIASHAAALPEIYADAALFFNPDDSRELAGRMHELMTDSKLRQRLIAKGIARAAGFSWDKMVTETLKIYENLLGLRPGQ